MTVYLVYKDGPGYFTGPGLEDIFSTLEKAETYVVAAIKEDVGEFRKINPATWENQYNDQFYIVKTELR